MNSLFAKFFTSTRAFPDTGTASLIAADEARTRRVQDARKHALSDAPMSLPTSNDFRGGFFTFQRKLSPQEIRFILEGAAAGNFNQQWDLFALMEDTWPRLAKNLAELRRAAARATFAVQPYAERGAKPTTSAAERATLIETAMKNFRPRAGTLELSFEDTLFHALDAYGKGISVLETQWAVSAAGLLPRCAHHLSPRRYGWNPDGTELGLITTPGSLPLATLTDRNPQSTSWQPFPQDKFLVGIWHARSGAPGATAVLRALAPYWVGITFGWEWLLSTAQIFGVPFRWATFDKNRPELGGQLRDMLAAMGSSGYGAFPDGTKLEFKEAVANATGNPQVILQEMADKACDLLILGQELSGTSRAAGLGSGTAQLHEGVRADRLQAAAQWCADLLNYQLVPAILRANYGDADEPPTIVPDVDEEADPMKLAQRDQVLLNSGVDLPRTWFYERHGIPEPVDGEAILPGRAAGLTSGLPNGGPETGSEAQTATESPANPLQARRFAVQGPCKALLAAGSDAVSGDAGREAILKANAAASDLAAKRPAFRPVAERLAALVAIDDPEELRAAVEKLRADAALLARAVIRKAPDLAKPTEEAIGTALVNGMAAHAEAIAKKVSPA